jgi:hypothetical protein
MKKILFSLLFLTGCGFTPLYGTQNHSLYNTSVVLTPIANQYGESMGRIIKNALPTPEEKVQNQYKLTVSSPSFSSYDKTITSDEFASTMQITANTTYQLQDLKTNKTILSEKISAVSSYSVVANPYATTVAKNKLQQELADQLAEQIALDVLTKLSQENS